jgi:hypothetical protein
VLEVTSHLTVYMLTASSSGTIGTLKEAFAAGSALIETKDDMDALPILREIAAEATAQREQDEVTGEAEPQSAGQGDRATLLPLIREAMASIDAKASANTRTIKQWLNRLAATVAIASREGGFLGFGGKRVSDEERVALDEIAAILGTTPAA